MALALKILGWLVGLFFKPAGPSPELQEAQSQGSATEALQTEIKGNVEIQKAAAAGAAVDAANARDPDGLRDPSPFSRD